MPLPNDETTPPVMNMNFDMPVLARIRSGGRWKTTAWTGGYDTSFAPEPQRGALSRHADSLRVTRHLDVSPAAHPTISVPAFDLRGAFPVRHRQGVLLRLEGRAYVEL